MAATIWWRHPFDFLWGGSHTFSKKSLTIWTLDSISVKKGHFRDVRKTCRQSKSCRQMSAESDLPIFVFFLCYYSILFLTVTVLLNTRERGKTNISTHSTTVPYSGILARNCYSYCCNMHIKNVTKWFIHTQKRKFYNFR